MNEITLTIDMLDGNTYPLTLNWARLLAVETSMPEAAAVYTHIINSAGKEFKPLDMARLVYLAYLCGQADSLTDAMPVEEFLDLLPTDLEYIGELFSALLTGGKKKNGSRARSKGARKTPEKPE